MKVHVGEYGVHWNFFFTLAAVAILSSIINVPPKYCGILGSIILIGILSTSFYLSFFIPLLQQFDFPGKTIYFVNSSGYQIWLMNGLNTYLLSNTRGTDLISQNKEGIFSIFGEH